MEYQGNYKPIALEGCYFVSLGVWAEELANKMTDVDLVNEAYALCVTRGSLDPNCFVQNPEKVINTFLALLKSNTRAAYIGWWNEDTGTKFWDGYDADDVDFEILRVSTPWGYHFKTPGFNPYPNLEQGTKINGKRYFKVL